MAYFSEYKARYMARRLGKSAPKILDYGCGVGLLSQRIKDAMPLATVDGFDISTESIRHVSAGLRKHGVFTSELQELRAGYDAVVVANVLHHVSVPERPAVVSSLCRRLVSKGVIFFFEHNPWNPLTRWAVRQCEFDADAVLLTASETMRYVADCGLRVQRDYIVFFPKFLRTLRFTEPWLGWCPLGGQYMVTGVRS